MQNTYYKLPIRFNSIFEEESDDIMPMCNEMESIDQHIELLITTCPGEHKFNKSYGCLIWDMDFERVVARQRWEDDFTTYITNSINDFETRLKDVYVSIEIMEVTREDTITKTTAIKKKVIVRTTGILSSTGDKCGFKHILFLGPLSTE